MLLSVHVAHAMLMLCCLTEVFDCQLPAMEIVFMGLRGNSTVEQS
jgi:hypothetical protein